MKQSLLLTGAPGTGKTTLIRQAITAMPGKTGGFYTQEIRTQGIRQGFEIVTLDGQRAVLSHTGIRSSHRVGKYGVDIDALNGVGVQAIRVALKERDIVVVDEIGKMELFSPAFQQAILDTLDSGKRLLGTIMLQPHPWANRIKADPRVELVTVTRTNHQQLLNHIETWLAG